MVIACEVHPIQNLRVLNYVKKEYNQTEEQVNRWAQQWIDLGLSALEQMIGAQSKPVNHNKLREMGASILAIEKDCMALPAFANAAPEKQPDAE